MPSDEIRPAGESLEYRIKHLKRCSEDSPREGIVTETMIWAAASGHLPNSAAGGDGACTDAPIEIRPSVLESILRKTVEATADRLLCNRPFAPSFTTSTSRKDHP